MSMIYYDNSVRLIDSEESLPDLLANFMGTDREGKECLDFRKIVETEYEQEEAAIRGRLSDTLEGISKADLEFLRRHEEFKKELSCGDKHLWHKENYGLSYFSFRSPQHMWFGNAYSIMDHEVHSLAVLIKRPLRFSWLDLLHHQCGWYYIQPEGESSGGTCDFESSLAPEWLWSDLAEDPNWPHKWLEGLRARKQDKCAPSRIL
jgi:hypothetical protein